LNERSNEKVFLNANSNYKRNFIHIKDYLNAQFMIGSSVSNRMIEWLGYEFEEDVCWIYGQVPIDKDQRVVFIQNRILTDIYDGQQNLIHFINPSGIESELATIRNPEVRFIRE
ncbi:MAG: DUF6702 family protein, partial [Salibacteraceae bacterium]